MSYFGEGKSVAILVTGGCGFIGSNFVLDWVASRDEPVINVDKLTYAGNPTNLSSLEGSNRYRFVKAGIEDGEAIAQSSLVFRSEDE